MNVSMITLSLKGIHSIAQDLHPERIKPGYECPNDNPIPERDS